MRERTCIVFPFVLAVALGSVHAQPTNRENLKIYAAAAVKTSLTNIAAEYERETGNMVSVVFDSAGATLRSYLADTEAVLLITTPARIGGAESAGDLESGTSIVLGTTVAGVAVPPGSPKPDISTEENLRTALLAAERIAFSDPSRGATVGNHFMTVIASLGVQDEVLSKATLARNGVETMRLVLEEGVDIGITQTVEILQANRAALAGPFPGKFELATAYSLWYTGDLSPAVEEFVGLLLGPTGREEFVKEGLMPPAAR